MKYHSYVSVVLPHPPYQFFDYAIPAPYEGQVEPGMEVLVPLGRRKTIGLVVTITPETKTPPDKIKEIFDVLSPFPILPPPLLKLAIWLSEYYLAPLSLTIRTVFPGFLHRKWSKVIALKTPTINSRLLKNLSADELKILDCLNEPEELDYEILRKKSGLKNTSAAVKKLMEKGIILSLEKMTRPPVSTREMSFIRLNKPLRLEGLTVKQKEALSLLISSDEAPLNAFCKQNKISASVINILARKNRVSLVNKQVRRDPSSDIVAEKPKHITLSDAQQDALKVIETDLQSGKARVNLLHGVTGSGKTEVYLRAVAAALKMKKTALILVPEIALTPLLISRFMTHFSGRIAIWHSRLSAGERFDEWQRIINGKVSIVIGARSALFAPLSNLGLIVVEEEHESSFKQTETPRYQGRDVAIMRAQIEKATVILGTATPSLESYHNSSLRKNRLLSLPQRIYERPLPRVSLVDLREENLDRDEMFSRELILAIEDRLERSEQIILFLNRRGYAPFALCLKCGESLQCKQCDVSLVYHETQDGGILKCHYCFTMTKMPSVCPRCQAEQLRLIGWGTQRVEEELLKIFPQARISRLDTDTTSRKGAYLRIFKQFNSGKSDILLGTQMVAKGFDFPNVTLVGVILADTSLHLADFRASERTFQLLTQVAGRTGRSAKGGEVIIQTYLPEHYSLQAARRHNYAEFFAREIELRRELQLPPYYRLISVVLSCEDEDTVSQAAMKLADNLRRNLGENAEVLGPGTPVIYRVQNHYRYQLILKSRQPGLMKSVLKKCLLRMKGGSKIRYSIDVDPISIF